MVKTRGHVRVWLAVPLAPVSSAKCRTHHGKPDAGREDLRKTCRFFLRCVFNSHVSRIDLNAGALVAGDCSHVRTFGCFRGVVSQKPPWEAAFCVFRALRDTAL